MSASAYKEKIWREFWFNLYYGFFPENEKWGHKIEFECNISAEQHEEFYRALGG